MAFSIMTETPMVAISGSNSLPRCRKGAKIAAFISQPSAPPTTRATAMLGMYPPPTPCMKK
jgi:hypothetical protein